MTNVEIIALAEMAAQNAVDAHGPEACPALIAYDFVRQMAYDDHEGTDEEAQAAWDGMALSVEDGRLFDAAYAAKVAELAAGQDYQDVDVPEVSQ